MVSLMWGKMFDPTIGLINSFFRSIGLGSWAQLWLGDSHTAIYAVAFVLVWHYIGYHMLIMYAGIQSIPEQIYEAAKLDGATSWRLVYHITIPLLADVLKVNVVLSVVGSLKVFEQIYVMTGGGPDNSTTVIALRMFQEAFLKMNFGYGSALAVFLVIQCMGIAYLINKLFPEVLLDCRRDLCHMIIEKTILHPLLPLGEGIVIQSRLRSSVCIR